MTEPVFWGGGLLSLLITYRMGMDTDIDIDWVIFDALFLCREVKNVDSK